MNKKPNKCVISLKMYLSKYILSTFLLVLEIHGAGRI